MEYDANKLSEKVNEEKIKTKKYPWEPDDEDFDIMQEEEKFSFKEILMFNYNSKTRKILTVIDLILCLISGYLYMWLARFGDEIDSEELFIFTTCMEVFFGLSMYTNFMTDFLPDGQSEPC